MQNDNVNFRMLFFSGIITALVGALLGLIIAHIAEKESRQRTAVVIGSTVGFAVGVGYEAIQQNRER